MQMIASLAAGVLFGAGLTVSQMTNPAKILDFLDITTIGRGAWDPTLLMVFGGALVTMYLAYVVQRRMSRPLAAPVFLIPRPGQIDSRLIAGSAIFGIGWGMVGICPGPAITSLATAGTSRSQFALFVAAMLAGIWLSRWLPSTSPPATEPRTT